MPCPPPPFAGWTVPFVSHALRLVFQSLLVETDAEVAGSAVRVWRLLLVQCPPSTLTAAAAPAAAAFFALATTPAGQPLPPQVRWPLLASRCRYGDR